MKNCKQCNTGFEVTGQDSAFYEKIKVPEPTLCPPCRMQRRMSFRNERNLFKRKCDFSGKEILSIYPPTSKYKIYDQPVWWSDKWDALEYGRDFDFSRPFFDQFNELLLSVPRINLQNRNNENSEYCNDSSNMKNSYLCFNTEGSEDLYYVNTGGWSKSCMDLFWCLGDELCYECIKVHESYHCFWCNNSKNLSDCFFCEDCQSCKNCFGCVGLRQKEYCVYNKQLSKEEYFSFLRNFNFTHPEIIEAKRKWDELHLSIPHKHLQIHNSEDCSGDHIADSKHCTECFDVLNSENSKYIWDGIVANSYDCYNAGLDSNYLYECAGVYKSNNSKFCNKSGMGNSDLEYCDYCQSCEYCFGCVGLYKKKYCIFNKQYSKEEYEVLVSKIIEHMKSTGEYGEFFPSLISPFGYNDSMAYEYFPLTKEEAVKKGFNWNDYISPKAKSAQSIPASRLPDSIREVPDDILDWAIECEKDGKPYKIISQELKFYRKQGLPVPRFCPDCRHYARKAQVNPRKLNDRKCDNCSTPIKTTYSPERPEKVYCEQCYLKEVY